MRIRAVFFVLAFGLYPLIVGAHGYSDISSAKWVAFLIIFGGGCACGILFRLEMLLIGKGTDSLKPSAFTRGPASFVRLFIFLFLVLSAFSTALSIDSRLSFWGGTRRNGLLTLLIYVACSLLMSFGISLHKTGRAALWAAGVSVTICCAIAVLQLAQFNPLHLYPDGLNYYDAFNEYTAAFLGTIGNIDLLSAFLSMAIPGFLCALIVLKSSGSRRLLLLIPLLLSLYVLLRMSVAGGILGTAGALMLMFPALLSDRKKRMIAFAIVASLIVAVIAVIYFFGSGLSGTPGEFYELLHGNIDDMFGSGRIYIWRTLWPLVGERPLFGAGPDTLSLRSTAEFAGIDYSHNAYLHSVVDNAHNEYLGILLNLGVFGLIAYLGMLVSVFICWLRRAPENLAAAICGSAVCGYSIQAFFNIDSPVTTVFFWLLLGMMLGSDADDEDRSCRLKRQ